MNIKEIIKEIGAGTICEAANANVELKSNWDQEHGKRISAIANGLNIGEAGYLVVGVNNQGTLEDNSREWLLDTEQKLSSHIRQYLSPTSSAVVTGQQSPNGKTYLVVSIENPGDITTWNHKVYKRVGTQTQEMTPDERLELTLRLPGQDYSKRPWTGVASGALVEQFAKKLIAQGYSNLPEDLAGLTNTETLQRIRCNEKIAGRILFGDLPVRVAYYDAGGDVIEQVTKHGAFSILTDEFIAEVQRWTKGKGTVLVKDSIAATHEDPYPLKAIRECFANAVAHALYERDDGEIIIDLHQDRIVIRNNCTLDVKKFAQEWFSKKSWSRSKFLMQLLREAGYTDELGSGKTRLYSQMLESGKREPLIDYYEKGTFACWQVTLYNEQNNKPYVHLLERFKTEMGSVEEARLATALTLWREQKWHDILNKLDQHYQNLAKKIVQKTNSPIVVFGDMIFTKRWVNSALIGKNSVAFTAHEEALLQRILQQLAYNNDRQGRINTQEAKRVIGLSVTPSESTQLSNLFRKWRSGGILKDGSKRGEWIFVNPPIETLDIISNINTVSDQVSEGEECQRNANARKISSVD